MSRASALYRLQVVDIELDKHTAMLAAVDAKLASNPAVQKAQAELKAAAEALAEARRAAKAIDDENQTLSNKIQETETRLYSGSVRNPRELQDLQADVESLKRQREALDEKQLAAMDNVEAAEKRETAARAGLEAAEVARAEEQGELVRDRGVLLALIEKSQGEREAALISVNVEDRDTYDTLRRQKRIAVSMLTDGTCTVCGVAPSSSRVQAARAGGDLVRCSNCGRILYAEKGGGHFDTDDKEDEMIHRW